jgi:predicted  nucleic acid-binding Zn-ribbon protein
VNPKLESLLALQECDQELDVFAAESRAITEREKALDRERTTIAEALQRARTDLEQQEHQERTLSMSANEHRDLAAKYNSQMDAVRKQREAEAAMSQIEIARKVVASDEAQLHSVHSRIRDLRQAAELHQLELSELETNQSESRQAIAAERSELEKKVAQVRAKRSERATGVDRQLLHRYDRLRTRGHAAVLIPLFGNSCGNCHTAIPMQRRNEILSGNSIETCEACGVLLYAMP